MKRFNFKGAARLMDVTVWGKLASMAVDEAVGKDQLFEITNILRKK